MTPDSRDTADSKAKQEVIDLRRKAKTLLKRAKIATLEANKIYRQALEIESPMLGFVVGAKVRCYRHIGVKRPRWMSGVIASVWHDYDGAGCAFIKYDNGKGDSFFFDSMRIVPPEEGE